MIHNEDCIKTMERMESGSIDMILTSPPYDDLRDYKGYSFDFEGVSAGMLRVLKKGGVAVWVVGDRVRNGSESGTSFRHATGFIDAGLGLYQTIIYNKDAVPQPGNLNAYARTHEYAFVFSKGRPATCNILKDKPNKNAGVYCPPKTYRNAKGEQVRRPKGYTVAKFGRRGSVWTYGTGLHKSTKDKIAFKHPAIMPEGLAEDMIKSWSNPDDIVYDPFMGSGTTAKMAMVLKRRWVGSEISAEYCDLIKNRIGTDVQEKLA